METIRLEVRHRSVFLDQRPFVFVTEDGGHIEETSTRGVVDMVQRHVRRRMRGKARDFGLAQILASLRHFNSPKEGYTQFVIVEADDVEQLQSLKGRRNDYALDQAVVRAIQARTPVDHFAIERWARARGLWIGLSGKNQILGGKARLTTEGLLTDFEPNKLVARSLLDKPEAFRGGTLRVLVTDDPFVNQVTGDGAFLVRASAARECVREVTQRVRRTLDYEVRDAKRGEVYLELAHERKRARHDTEILSVREDGDVLWIEKRERCRIDTGAKLVHEKGFKGTAIVVQELPEHIRRQWPDVDAVTNASCLKSSALISGHGQEVLTGDFERGWYLHLPVRLLFTGEERVKGRGNRVSLNVLSTLHTVSPAVMQRMVEARVDESPGPVIRALLWWADHLKACLDPDKPAPVANGRPVRSKALLKEEWGDQFERRLAFGDLADHPVFDAKWNPEGFWAKGRGGNRVLVPSARALLATLGHVEVEGEPGFWFPEYLNSVLMVVRSLDVRPPKFRKALSQLRSNVTRAANGLLGAHSIRVPGIHGVLVAVRGLGARVVVPNGFGSFQGLIHGEPTMGRDGVRQADVLPLARARRRHIEHPGARYLLDNLVQGEFHVILADWTRLTRMNRDNDGDLVYLSRLPVTERELHRLDAEAEAAPGFVDPDERFRDLTRSFEKLQSCHDPYELPPEAVHKAVLETAGSARDVGSITLFKYVVNEALANAKRLELTAPVARLAQAYIDGMKGTHQTSANLFAALMRVWSRMAIPCRAVKDEGGAIVAVRLMPNLQRELLRAGYVEGKDFHGNVDVPHPSLVDEAFRRIKRPLVGILEAILRDLEDQRLATRSELKAIRDVLEVEYGQYPSVGLRKGASLVAERKATYTAVRRLYGISPVKSWADVESVGVRPLWRGLLALSTDPGEGTDALQERAERALAHGVREARLVEF